MMYHSEPNRSIPSDEKSAGDYRVIRNGKLYARRETPGAARALVRNAIRVAGAGGDQWAIKRGTLAVPL